MASPYDTIPKNWVYIQVIEGEEHFLIDHTGRLHPDPAKALRLTAAEAKGFLNFYPDPTAEVREV